MIGRSPTYLLTLLAFVFFEFAVIYARNFGMLLAFRFLTGFVGSPALATGAASIGDIWSPMVRDYMIAVWGMFAISAPMLGPMLGRFPGEGGLSFMGIFVGTCLVIIVYFYWKYRWQSAPFDKQGNIAPEQQMPPACVGAIALPISLFWFGWTGNFASVHWIVPIIASIFFAVDGCLIFNCSFCYLAHAYPRYAASAMAGNDFLRSSFGAGFPLFATAMFRNLGVGWACTLLGCLTVLFMPIPFILFYRGRRIWMASRFARHDI